MHISSRKPVAISPIRPMLGMLALGFAVSSAPPRAAAQEAVAPGAPTSGAPPLPDKSQYTLFNPTPASLMRPFCTDRPGKSHCAQTVDAGHFQYEGDFWNYTWDGYTTSNITFRDTIIGTPNLKIGLNNWAEFDAVLALYNNLEIRSRQDAEIQHAYGFGDVLVGGKVNFFGNDGGDQAMGAIGFVKIPTAAGGLGNNMVEFALNVPYTVALPDRFFLTLEPAIGLLRNFQKQGYHGDYQIIANLNRAIIGDVVTAALEISLDFSTDHNVGPRHTLDPSLQWLITPAVQLDAGVYIGLTKAAPDYNPYVGISFRF